MIVFCVAVTSSNPSRSLIQNRFFLSCGISAVVVDVVDDVVVDVADVAAVVAVADDEIGEAKVGVAVYEVDVSATEAAVDEVDALLLLLRWWWWWLLALDDEVDVIVVVVAVGCWLLMMRFMLLLWHD